MRGWWVGLVLAAGCGGGRQAQPPASQPADTLARLQEEGGLTGQSRQLLVMRNGEARLIFQAPAPDTLTWTIAPAQRTQLQALVASPDFQRADSAYLPDHPCCDRITSRLTIYPRAGERRTVRVMDGADLPGPVQLTIGLLRQIAGTAPAR